MRKHKTVSLALAAFALTTAIGTGAAGVAGAEQADQVTICHGTASATNPYVEITVSANSFKDGHFDGGLPGHGPNNNPDFILSEGRTCADGPGGGGGEAGV